MEPDPFFADIVSAWSILAGYDKVTYHIQIRAVLGSESQELKDSDDLLWTSEKLQRPIRLCHHC